MENTDGRFSELHPLNADQQDLSISCFKMAKSLAAFYTLKRSIDGDEILSAAIFGLVKASKNYDITRGIQGFSHYAKKCIVGEILESIRGSPPQGYRKRKDGKRIGVSQLENEQDVFCDEDSIGSEIEFRDLLEWSMKSLPQCFHNLFRYIYIDHGTQREFAKIAGLTESSISKSHGKLLVILREKLQEQEIDG